MPLPLVRLPAQFAPTLQCEMHSIHVGKATTICRILALVVALVTIGSSTCVADQLQWNALGVCEDAVQVIEWKSLVVSYCSQADEDYVELWLVRRAYVVHTPAEGLFEIRVLAKRLYKSQKAFSAEEFPVPATQWGFNAIRDSGWSVEGIDLAYTYIYSGDSTFRCLGKVLELECLVGVETIDLPGDVMERMTPGRSPGPHASLQSFDLLLARRPRVSSKRVS